MKILSIDTSCDETAAAVTEGAQILSNVIWSQAKAHAKFGGVMPSLAQRMHEERIDWVISQSLSKAKTDIKDVEAIAVTIGPGLSIALGVGIAKAKELSKKYNKKLIAVNHLEGHLLSPFANDKSEITNDKFPMLGLIVSGGNTLLVKIDEIGKYEILAQTTDDALGEALDKSARMLGFGYPGGAILEKMARLGDSTKYALPVPISGHEERRIFTYSGLKTAMSRLIEKEKPLTKSKIYNLAASFQDTAFTHLIRVMRFAINHSPIKFKYLLVGGGVCANTELRKRLRQIAKTNNMEVLFPYSNKLTGDNAAMIGIAAYFKSLRKEFANPDTIDRNPNLKI